MASMSSAAAAQENVAPGGSRAGGKACCSARTDLTASCATDRAGGSCWVAAPVAAGTLPLSSCCPSSAHAAPSPARQQALSAAGAPGSTSADAATTPRGASSDSAAEPSAESPGAAGVLPVVDLAPFLAASAEARQSDPDLRAACATLAACLRDTGCAIVRDSRVSGADNEAFLDMMERYFDQPTQAKLADSRPELHYQVGVTPEGTEVPRCARDPNCVATIAAQPAGHRATLPSGADPKWRFMWRLGPRPARTQYAELNSGPVVPAGFPGWQAVMDSWGSKMLAAVEAAAEMAARGFGLPPDALTRRMHLGPHLLAPTGANLEKHGALGTCYAGFHYDLNLLTIHGKSRFPGLFVWLRDGSRRAVRIPDGCLIMQAGKQLEWLTGGHVRAGMHEVVCTEATLAAIAAARAGGRPLWRVSSTVFGHVASDEILSPLAHFADEPAARAGEYPPVAAGEYVRQELEAIRLKA